MAIEKINDAELERENIFHANNDDVPGLSAQEMKEFFDYVPRRVLIPKVNELVDSENSAQTKLSDCLPLSGGTMKGSLSMNRNELTGIKDPTSDPDAANKKYVDTGVTAAKSEAKTDNAALKTELEGKVTETKKYIDEKADELKAYVDLQTGGGIPWHNVQAFVRSGLAKDMFPLGYEFDLVDGNGQNRRAKVISHDEIKAANAKLTHTMALKLCPSKQDANTVDNISTIPFSTDRYYFSFQNGTDGGATGDEQYLVWNRTFGVEEKVYVKLPEKFLLNSGVMQIKLNAGDAAKGKSIVGKECCFYTDESYYSPISTATIEKYTDTLPNAYEISDDSIPESLQPVSMDNVNLLCIAANGCAEYEQSFIRHWLNLPKEGGNWESGGVFALPKADGKYIPQTIKGLQSILPDDFLSVVQPAAVECVEPPVYISHQANVQYTLKDKFFLLSDAQVYGSQTHSKNHEGEQLEYYKSLDNTERIEYATDGGAVNAFLRTPRNTTSLDSIGCNVCTTARTSGKSESYPARSQNVYFAPVCIIA